jgi:predicted nucleotide-binding protein
MAERRRSRKAAAGTRPKPEVFIGSSAEAVQIAEILSVHLRHTCKITTWPVAFKKSSYTLPDLEHQLSTTDYAILVFGHDDVVISRGRRQGTARDNVQVELGMSIGKLGHENTFVLVPKDRARLKIPSDLAGLNLVEYEDDRYAENPQAALQTATAELRLSIQEREKVKGRQSPADFAPQPSSEEATLPEAKLVAFTADLLEMVGRGNAGLVVSRPFRKLV